MLRIELMFKNPVSGQKILNLIPLFLVLLKNGETSQLIGKANERI